MSDDKETKGSKGLQTIGGKNSTKIKSKRIQRRLGGSDKGIYRMLTFLFA